MKIQIMNHHNGRESEEYLMAYFLKNNEDSVQTLKITFTKEDDGFDKTIEIDDFGEIT